jgi:hypothetical protein
LQKGNLKLESNFGAIKNFGPKVAKIDFKNDCKLRANPQSYSLKML